MPLHIIKMTMIVIFVPSPPHLLLLLLLRVPLALPSFVFSSPTPKLYAWPPIHTQTISIRGPCGRKKERFFLLSFSLVRRRRDTRRDREDSEIPSRPAYSLLSLGPAHRRALARVSAYSYVPLGVSFSLIPPLARSFLPRPRVQRFPPIRPKVSRRSLSSSCRVFQRVQRKSHLAACARVSVGRPRIAYIPVYVVYKRRQ